jgi:hypothetical protein
MRAKPPVPASTRKESDSPADVPPEFSVPRPTTGTTDDDDEPEDEHDGENEASERETRDSTEAPEEFQVDDED